MSIHPFLTQEGVAARATIVPGPGAPPAPAADFNRVGDGSTANFLIYHDGNLPGGAQLADALIATCEDDFERLGRWFSIRSLDIWLELVLGLDTSKVEVDLLPGGGIYSSGWNNGETIRIYLAPNDQNDHRILRMLFVAELDEIFMDASDLWNPANSNGEGLSRVLSFELYPPVVPDAQVFQTVPAWLTTVNHFGYRRDWVTKAEATDTDYISTGCATLFLNWLRYDLHFGWKEIIAAQWDPDDDGLPETLARRYTALTKDKDGPYRFDVRVDGVFPGRDLHEGGARPLPAQWTAMLNADNAFPATVQVTGVGGDGRLLHSLWRPNDWTAFRPVADVAGDPGVVIDAATGGIDGDMQLVVVTRDEHVLHTLRPAAGMPWTPFRPVADQAGNPGPVTAVAAAGVANEMHIAAATDTGKIMHAIRRASGEWQHFRQLGKTRPELHIASMAGAGVQGEFHLMFAFNGSVFHTIRHSGGGWDPVIDVQTKAGDPGGPLSQVTCS